jgi:hypothetical protein
VQLRACLLHHCRVCPLASLGHPWPSSFTTVPLTRTRPDQLRADGTSLDLSDVIAMRCVSTVDLFWVTKQVPACMCDCHCTELLDNCRLSLSAPHSNARNNVFPMCIYLHTTSTLPRDDVLNVLNTCDLCGLLMVANVSAAYPHACIAKGGWVRFPNHLQ